jgi:ABC-type hemin transport system substrate-binding protein
MKDPIEGKGKEIDYHRYWKDMYEQEHKLRQEAEGEMTILKGIETNRVKEAQDALANALGVNESHQKLNGKLQERITELEQDNLELHADNKKLALQIEDQVDRARKAGL